MHYFKKTLDTYTYLKSLTLDLVGTPSFVRTPSERKFALDLYELLAAMPYFKDHRDHLNLVALENDPLERPCVFALLEGKGSNKSDTVVLLSHYDTVGIDDFGTLAPWALDPQELKKHMRAQSFSEEVRADLDSEDWLFGRGTVDMKSGIALHLWLIKIMSENLSALNGNLLFVCTPDEEAMNKGAQAAAREIMRIKEERKLKFLGLMNTDYSAPRYKNDPHRHVYLGSIGKCLLSFFIGGVPTHAGECLDGLDANLVASRLVERLSLNCAFCDEAEGEITPPPVSLKQRDLKEVYDVQSPYESQVYFNLFTFTKTPDRILYEAKREAGRIMKAVNDDLNRQRKIYAAKKGFPFSYQNFTGRVYTYQEFYQKVTAEKPAVKDGLRDLESNYPLNPADETGLSLAMVRCLFQASHEYLEKLPVVVIYFSPPYLPAVHVGENTPEEFRFRSVLQETVSKYDAGIQIKPFFPYISDISWFAMNDSAHDIRFLKANSPGFSRTCGVDLETLSGLNIPSANIGPLGKDAHKATERLYLPYAFQTLPVLLRSMVKKLLSP